MSKLFKINTPISLSENEDLEKPIKYQLMKVGVFSFWESGDMIISSEMFLSFCDNFNKKVRGTDLAIDYSHNKFQEAAGWIKSLSTNEDRSELWADIEWTPKAKQKLKDKEYRYISAEFGYEYEDENGNKCGPTLFGAGLTNRPFLKNMEPLVNLSEDQQRIKKMSLEQKLSELENNQKNLEKSLAEKDNEIARLKKEKELSDKNNDFNKMLLSGKVCEAQREAFVAGDIVKFAELSEKVKLESVGHSEEGKKAEDSKNLSAEQAEEKILSLSEGVMKNENISFREAVKKVKKENPELAKKAEEKFE